MRVLHVAESIKGGVGTYLNEIVPVLAARSAVDAQRVLVPSSQIGQLPAIAPDMIVPFACDGRSREALVTLARELRRTVKAFRPDVIHAHSSFAGVVVRGLLGWRPGRPRIVYCPHGWAFDMEGSARRRQIVATIERLLAPLCDRIVTISDYERRSAVAVGIADRRMTTVFNGIADLGPPTPLRADDGGPRRLLFVGRLDRQKGFDVLLRAIATLGDRVSLRVAGTAVVGDGGAADLPANVTLLGWLGGPAIAAEVAAAELVVVPSRWEGFGLVAVEAMRGGRAVVASAVGGLPEVVEDGTTGRLVPVEDAAALAAALVADDAATLAAMGEAGRRRFERLFTVDRTVDGVLDVYAGVRRRA
ncbi:glycosyltransferase [Sphingomonas nostoxanthinifaciens]|uniref:glycosyltransferase n=1 Tax=Sphingomonas nostoxanthinifaciens TaxID=2872652 RepID=UPI001CC1C59E|nr:glycosyltransferase [Sphingomonas nostoxanthinifaciens]UAK23263.1 glycosyltransferase [Sphingomonas nostoxanthinifaciens]